jgi:hypothetical protein
VSNAGWLDPALGLLIVAGCALLFAAAAVHKLRSPAHFTEVFAAYAVLPAAVARAAAPLVPWVELTAAAALIWAPGRRAGIAAAIGLLLAYALAIAVNLRRGRRTLDCGCGPASHARPIAAWMVWRNLLLALAAAAAILPWSMRGIGPTDWLTVGGALAALTVLYLALDRLLGDIAPRARAMRGGA